MVCGRREGVSNRSAPEGARAVLRHHERAVDEANQFDGLSVVRLPSVPHARQWAMTPDGGAFKRERDNIVRRLGFCLCADDPGFCVEHVLHSPAAPATFFAVGADMWTSIRCSNARVADFQVS